MAFGLSINQKSTQSKTDEDGDILEKVVKDVTQSISFLDNQKPLYKQDFQSIINKFAEWATFLKKRSRSKDHILLLPTEIAIGKLVSKLEVALEAELGEIPRILVENEALLQEKMVCDVDKTTNLLVAAVLRVINAENIQTNMVRMQLHTTI